MSLQKEIEAVLYQREQAGQLSKVSYFHYNGWMGYNFTLDGPRCIACRQSVLLSATNEASLIQLINHEES